MKSLNATICIFFALIMVLILISCQDNKVVTTEGVVFEKIEGKDEYTIVGYTGTSENIVIAETHNGLPVTRVDAHAFRNLDLEIES
ncbi:MAG: hypothetical protein RG740_01750, partial [Acholeplasmataceae bacterium]|nr:hypothetical protein [Acholeplasmataceae bacterium]